MAKKKKQSNNKLDWLRILRGAAAQGKRAILKEYSPKNRRKVLGRGAGGDETLHIDAASERAIHQYLDRALGKGEYTFLSEEIGEVGAAAGNNEVSPKPIVLCDPLDGSHNAQVGVPFFSVALSLLQTTAAASRRTFANVEHAVILSVPTADEYYASKGKGAYHNGKKIASSPATSTRLETLLIECGDPEYLRKLTEQFSNEYLYKVRLLGSAALSLCLLAAGSAQGLLFVQPGGARSIDSPAGYLIAKEAGCAFGALGSSRTVAEHEIGFHSRLNLVGAAEESSLQLLLSRVTPLPD